MDTYYAHILLKTIDFWALFACIGLLIARAGLLPAFAFEIEEVESRWFRLLGWALSLLSFTGAALLVIRIMAMSDSASLDALRLLPAVLRQTHFGHVWTMHFLCLLLLWVGWMVSRKMPGRSIALIMLVTVAATAWTYSATTHAADSGDFTMSELGDWLHVLSASLWGGSILVSAIFIGPVVGNRSDQERKMIGDMVGRLSTLSAIALGLILITGIYNVTMRINNVDELLHSSYGQVLCLKLMLVVAMVGIGALNRFTLVPLVKHWGEMTTVVDDTPIQRFVAAIRVDAVLVLLVLCAVAVLIQKMPPSAMARMSG